MSNRSDTVTATTGRIIFEVLRLSSRLVTAGDALVGDLGLTSARWQVLATAASDAGPATVSAIAHNLGLARQSVQRVANELAEIGLVDLVENPNHKRARLVAPSKEGRAVLQQAEVRRLAWTKELARNLKGRNVGEAEAVLVQLRRSLDQIGS